MEDFKQYLDEIMDDITQGRVLCQIEKDWKIFHSVIYYILLNEFHNDYYAEKETKRYFDEIKYCKEEYVNFYISKDFSTGCIRYNHYPSPALSTNVIGNMFDYHIVFSNNTISSNRQKHLAEGHVITVINSPVDIAIMRAHYVRGTGVIFAPSSQVNQLLTVLAGDNISKVLIPDLDKFPDTDFFGLRTIRNGAYFFGLEEIKWDLFNVSNYNFIVREETLLLA